MNTTSILLIALIAFLLLAPLLTPLISFVAVVGIIVFLTIALYLSTRNSSTEMYNSLSPNTSAGFAAMFQETPLPSADDLAEEGGGYAIEQGIQSPQVSRTQDPWLHPDISWN